MSSGQQTLKDKILKALEELNYNAEVFFHFWAKDRETAMLAYRSLNIRTMTDLSNELKVLY